MTAVTAKAAMTAVTAKDDNEMVAAIGDIALNASMPAFCKAVASRQAERMAFIRDGSTAAGDHVHFLPGDTDGVGCLAEDALAWTDDAHSSGWRGTIRRIWLEYPKLSHMI